MKILILFLISLFSYVNCFSKLDFRYKVYLYGGCKYVHVTMYEDHDNGSPSDDTILSSTWFRHCNVKMQTQNDLSAENTGKNNNSDIIIYPNPASSNEHLNFKLGNISVNLICIYNTQGQLLIEKKGHFAENYSFALDGLQSGIYLLSIRTNTNQIINSKLFIL